MTIYLVVLMALLNQLAFSGSRVAVSLYALELGASQFSVGVIVALYSVCPILMAISIGKFTDRTAPRLPMLISALVMIAALLLPSVFSGLATLFVAALFLGFCHLLYLIPLEATVGGIGGGSQRAKNYSLLTMGWAIANLAGPIIAGFSIDYLSHRSVFLVLAAISVLPTLMLYFMPALLPKPGVHAAEDRRGSVMELWHMPPVRFILIASAVIGAGQDLFQFYFPIYGHAIGISASAIGTIIGMVAVAAFVIRGILPLLVKRIPEPAILTYAVFISAAAFALLPFFANPYALGAIAFVLGLGVGCANPMTMSLLYARTPTARIAEAIGLQKTFRNITHIVIPLFFGSVGAAFGFFTVFLSNSVLLAIGGALVRKVDAPETERGENKSD